MALISNISLLTAEALTGEPNYKEPTFNNEPSPDNYEATAFDLIPPPNGDGAFNAIGRYKCGFEKGDIFVRKTDFESMLDESGFGAATKIGGFTLDKGPEVSLAT